MRIGHRHYATAAALLSFSDMGLSFSMGVSRAIWGRLRGFLGRPGAFP